jgi:hypothetical protein
LFTQPSFPKWTTLNGQQKRRQKEGGLVPLFGLAFLDPLRALMPYL